MGSVARFLKASPGRKLLLTRGFQADFLTSLAVVRLTGFLLKGLNSGFEGGALVHGGERGGDG